MTKMKKLMWPTAVTLGLSLSAATMAASWGGADGEERRGNPPQAKETEMRVIDAQRHDYTAQANPLAVGLIVKYKEGFQSTDNSAARARVQTLNAEYDVNMSFKRMMSGDAEVYSFVQSASSSGAQFGNRPASMNLQQLVQAINDRPEVEYAEIDAWMVPMRTPNDPSYSSQWHYDDAVGGLNLEDAWDTTTGSSAVTVAVLDTGYRPHADLVGNVVGQYDMISSSSVSNDGGGRDSNAQDPGDWTTNGQCGVGWTATDSSWHGTHVAGTVAAVSDNGTGVAGVAWDVNLVPVRVLGTCGGSLSDIADGIRWAAGLSVSGVPSNSNPADVINMSLGASAPSACSSTYQNAINAAVAQGTTVVVAAGNSNSSSGYPPANCNNVVSVAATAIDGGRAYYSNFGSAIDVAAPGGDGCNPTSNSAPASLSDCQGGVWKTDEMILSTYNTGSQGPGSDSYDWLQGTSMASPHVAGVAALLYSVDPGITPAEVETILKDTARAFPSVSNHQCTTSNCGDGIVDAAAAVAAANGNPPPPPPPPGDGELTNGVAETGLSGAASSQQFFTLVVPAGASNLSFSISGGSGDADMYVRFGSQPTTGTWDCRPYLNGNNETCNISNVQAGTYHVMLRGWTAYSGVSLVGSFTAPGSGGGAAFYQNTSNVNIPDNNSGGGTSNINVTRSGASGTVTVNFEIVHTWRGDLEVELVAPNSTTVVLHARTNPNDSTDNLSATVNVDAGSINSNGTWSLVVRDLARFDTGFIDSWSLEFQ